MPEVSRFYGIVIMMFYKDHNPPHFHANYGEYKVVISIEEGLVNGYMPKRALKMVFEWMEIHKEALVSNWERGQRGEQILAIKPLQ